MSKADDYLSQFALYNFDAYCLGVVFTSVDFDGGVLGLAWVGFADPKGPPGGNNVEGRGVLYYGLFGLGIQTQMALQEVIRGEVYNGVLGLNWVGYHHRPKRLWVCRPLKPSRS